MPPSELPAKASTAQKLFCLKMSVFMFGLLLCGIMLNFCNINFSEYPPALLRAEASRLYDVRTEIRKQKGNFYVI